MKFKNYLTENNISFGTVKKDCSYFLNKYPNLILYRGYKKLFTIEKFMPRKDRVPLDSDPIGSKALDKASKKIFGWPCRSQGTFVTKNIEYARFYGKPYFFLPIGSSWKYIYSPGLDDSVETINNLGYLFAIPTQSKDYNYVFNILKSSLSEKKLIYDKNLNKDLDNWYDMVLKNENPSKIESIKKQLTKRIAEEYAIVLIKNKYTNKNLDKTKNEEVIFNCQKEGYYLIDPDIYL